MVPGGCRPARISRSAPRDVCRAAAGIEHELAAKPDLIVRHVAAAEFGGLLGQLGIAPHDGADPLTVLELRTIEAELGHLVRREENAWPREGETEGDFGAGEAVTMKSAEA